jgi:hypothetical protein
MLPATLTSTTFSMVDASNANTPVDGLVQLNPDGMTASFVPDQPLPVDHTFVVTVSNAVKDITGNNLASQAQYSFTTGFEPETAPPHLVSHSPLSNSNNAPTNALIALRFSQPLGTESVAANVQLSAGAQNVPVMMAFTDGNQRLVLTPAQPLAPATQYTVTVGAGISDVAGIPLDNPGTFSFQTTIVSDTTGLSITAVDPVNHSLNVPVNAILRVEFNKPADITTLVASNFTLTPLYGGQIINLAVTPNADGSRVSLTPTPALENEHDYCLSLAGVMDMEGNVGPQGQLACFTTGISTPQTTGPVVLTVSPPDGSSGVPVNTKVQLLLSEPVSAASVGANAITVTPSGGSPVSGTVTATESIVTWAPASNLAAATTYTVKASGFTDLANNPVTSFTSTFSTSPAVEAGPLKVLSIIPANGQTNVPTGSAITITFNEPVNPVTVNTLNVLVVEYATGYTVAGNFSVNGSVVTWTPSTPMPASTLMAVYVGVYYGDVQDYAGNNCQTASSTFTTAGTTDNTPPAVVSVVPGNGATGVGQHGQVVITFSKSMNASTFQQCCPTGYPNVTYGLIANGVEQAFSPAFSADNRTLTLYGLSLPASSDVTLILTNKLSDLSGNALPDYQSHFTTMPAADNTNAAVVSMRPASGATAVPVNTRIVLYVNKPLNAATVPGAMHVLANGVVVNGTVNVLDNNQAIEFVPSSTLPYGAVVQVYLDPTALDMEGDAVNGYSLLGQFTLVSDPAITTPALINESPMAGQTVPTNSIVHLQYSEPLNPAYLTSQTVYLYDQGGNVAAAVALDTTGTVVQISPATSLKPNDSYCVFVNTTVAPIYGVNGLPIASTNYCFSTGAGSQSAAVAVASTTPPDGLANVPVNANAEIVFSAAIDPTTVSASTIQLTDQGQNAIPYAIAFSNNNATVLLTPQLALPASASMTLSIMGVKDTAGNAVTPKTVHFTTAATANTALPVISVANPSPNTVNVPLNAVVSLQANTAIDPLTISSSTFRLFDTVLSQIVPATYSESNDATTLFLVPSAPLAANRLYDVRFLQNGMKDLAGNLCCDTNYITDFPFTTGAAASTSGPQVTGTSPANSLQGVPVNAHLAIRFNEPVDAETLGQVSLSANGNAVAIAKVLSTGNQILTLIPSDALAPNTTYTVSVSGVEDMAQNPMPAAFTSTFKTASGADLSIPSAVSLTPANHATNVSTTTTITVVFSKAMDALSITSGTFTLLSNNTAIPGAVTASGDGVNAVFTPNSALQPNTTYTVQLSSGITDLEGQALIALTTTFTTGAQ